MLGLLLVACVVKMTGSARAGLHSVVRSHAMMSGGV
jgi:hypothetical protein